MIPQRIILAVMAFFGVAVCFAMRASLSIAITEMVKPIETNNIKNNMAVCSDVSLITENITKHTDIAHHNKGKQYSWTQEEQGWVLSSFFGGYLIGHFPGATFTHKFSAKWIFSLSILLSSVCNAATPIFLEYGDLSALVLIRALMGLFGAFLFPGANMLLAAWVPKKERSRLGILVLGGGQVGGIFSFYVTGLLLTFYPWPVSFYFWSIITAVWFIAFALLCSKDPVSHPFITKKEKDFLEAEIGQLERDSDLPPIPWKHIITSVPVIALLISQMGSECMFVLMVMELPKYMKEIIGFPVHEIGFYLSVASLLSWSVSILSGFLSDFLIGRKYLTTVQTRKLFTALSSIFPPIFLMAISYVECNRIVYIQMMFLAAIFGGNYWAGVRLNPLDLAPNYAGALLSYINGVGTIVTFIFPIFVGIIISDSTIEQWRVIFWVVFGVAMVRVITFSIWGSGSIQAWNNPKKRVTFECEKLTDDTAKKATEEITFN